MTKKVISVRMFENICWKTLLWRVAIQLWAKNQNVSVTKMSQQKMTKMFQLKIQLCMQYLHYLHKSALYENICHIHKNWWQLLLFHHGFLYEAIFVVLRELHVHFSVALLVWQPVRTIRKMSWSFYYIKNLILKLNFEFSWNDC